MAKPLRHRARCRGKQGRAPGSAGDSQSGATLIEFVLVVPILVGLLFAILEFGWTSYQMMDTRHVAREGARLVAVNYSPTDNTGTAQRDALIEEICLRLENPGASRVSLEFEDPLKTDAGDLAIIRIERDLEQLTYFYNDVLEYLIPSSEIKFRLERAAGWLPTTGLTPCP